MTIQTLDGVVAGAQPPWHFAKATLNTSASHAPFSCWQQAFGIPGSGSYNTTLNGGTYSSSSALVPGQIPHYDPVGGNSYLCRFVVSNQPLNGLVMLCDRLWDNGGITITSTSLQSISSPTWPARDLNGSTNGAGVLIAVEVSAACASTATLTLGYTSSAGTSGRTATIASAAWSATVNGCAQFFPWVSGDVGVQSVQSITLSASMTSGTINLVALRVIACVSTQGTAGLLTSQAIDAIKGGFQPIYNGTVPYLVAMFSSTNPSYLSGTYQETQG